MVRLPGIDRERLRRAADGFRRAAALARAAVKDYVGGWPTVRALSVLVIPLALAPWLYAQIGKELASPLFRDAVQCQYSGWCMRHGMKLYRDVGAPDGPLIHFMHAIMQAFVGITDAACRKADLYIHVAGSAAMGALLAPRFAETRIASILQRLAWALAAVALWLSWYITQGWAQTVQRDAYYALFGYLGMVLIYASADFSPRGARVAAFLGGALSMLIVFSRHSGIIFPACALLAVVLADDPVREQRAARLKAALVGAGVVTLLMLLALLLFGSLGGMRFWFFKFPFVYYRWVGKQNAFQLLTEGFTGAGLFAVVALVGVLAAAATRAVPVRGAAFGFPPFLFLIAAAIVGKGWPNHVQQVTAAQIPLELLVMSRIWSFNPERARWRPNHAVAAVIALLFVAYRANQALNESTYYKMVQPQQIDPDITQAQEVAKYLKQHTGPDDTVFMYGHESHVLLDAERRTAIPYFTNYLLNIDVLYKATPAGPKAQPGPKDLEAMKNLQVAIAAEACGRLVAKPPAAFVFLDGSLTIFRDGVAEVVALCPAVGPMLKERYAAASLPSLPRYHVFLRKKP